MGGEFVWRSIGESVSCVVDNRGKTPPLSGQGDYELIEVNALKGDSKFPLYGEVRKYVDSLTYQTWFRKGHPKPGDVLFSTVGSIAEVAVSEGRGCIAQNVIALSPDQTLTDGNFLYYLLRSPAVKSQLMTLDISSVQPSIKVPHLLAVQLPWPDFNTQQAIAHILGSLDDKIELNRQMNATLESMAQALFKSWFIDFDPVLDNAIMAGNLIPDKLQERAKVRRSILEQNQPSPPAPLPVGEGGRRAGEGAKHNALAGKRKPLPEAIQQQFPSGFVLSEEMGWIPGGWEVAKLGDLLEVKYGKDHKKLSAGAVPVYGSGGLMRNADKSLYKGESVLIPRKGTLSNILYLNEEFWTVDTMFYTIPKRKFILKYVFYHLKGLDFESMNVGSAVPSMTTKVLNELPILTPMGFLLESFDSILTTYFNKSEMNKTQSKGLTSLRDTLLPKLLSGQLRIPDAEKLVADAV